MGKGLKILFIVYDNESNTNPVPLGMLYIASYIRKHGFNDITFYNQDVFHYPEEHLTDYLNKNHFDVIGIGFVAGYWQHKKIIKIVEAIKKSTSKACIVLGGQGPSPIPEFYLRLTGVDFIISGEGEKPFLNLLQAESFEELEGVSWIDVNDNFCSNPRGEPIKDLTEIPYPAFDLVPVQYYLHSKIAAYHVKATDNYLAMITGRGCPYNCNFCFSYDSLVNTDKGFLPIGKIVEEKMNVKVLSGGKWNKITEFHKRKHIGEMLTIKVKGLLPFQVTPNHKITTLEGEKRADELLKGDKLLIDIPPEMDISKIDLNEELKDSLKEELIVESSYVKYKRGKNKVNRFITVDEDFCRLVGLFLAEGCVVKHNARRNSYYTTWNFSINEEELATETVNLIQKVFGVSPYLYKMSELSVYRVSISNSVIGMFFLKMFGKIANNKAIPSSWLGLPINKIESLLNGYYDGDGHYYIENNSIHVGTVSPHLANQLVILNVRLGKYASITFAKKEEKSIILGREVNVKDVYHIVITDGSRFGGQYRAIKSIEISSYDNNVYNLGVDNIHYYTINCLKVHNCFNLEPGIRLRPMEDVVNEVIKYQKDYNLSYIAFWDELFMLSEKRVAEFHELIMKNNIKIKYWCTGRFNIVNSNILQMLKETGCEVIDYGIEQFDNYALEKMNKRLTEEQIVNGIELTQKYGITIAFNIIFGNIGDTRESLKKSIALLDKYNDYGQLRVIRPVTPYPGTSLWNIALERGLIKDAEDFYNKHVNLEIPTCNFTDIPDDEFLRLMYQVNSNIIDKYYLHLADELKKDFHNTYFERDFSFRGGRH